MEKKFDERLARFGCALRSARKTQGLSQEDLADRAGLDRTYVSGCERGMRNPTLTTIGKLADALGLEIRELF